MQKTPSNGNQHPLLPPYGFFYMHHPTDRIAHTTAFVTPVVEHWLEREGHLWNEVSVLIILQRMKEKENEIDVM